MYLGFTPMTAQPLVAASGPAAPFLEAGLLATQLLSPLQSIFHIRAGADEADKIVPTQNEIHQGLAQVDQILQTSNSIPQLQDVFKTVQTWGRDFLEFITSDAFTDGRASEQAANTLMPLIDGTGGYTWPEMQGHKVSTDKWGNPTDGGRLGSLSRRILSLGGTAAAPQIMQAGMGPTLVYQTPGSSYIPQSGYIPPVSPLPHFQSVNAGFAPSVGGNDLAGALPLLFVGGLLLFRPKRRGR